MAHVAIGPGLREGQRNPGDDGAKTGPGAPDQGMLSGPPLVAKGIR